MHLDWRGIRYADHCPFSQLCPEHLEAHRAGCGFPIHPCDVCKDQPKHKIKE